MATSASPTAHLLRTSRLFSLPPPLRKPSHTTSISSTIDAFSPTATLPYPSSAAIETTSASLAKGDWGLKRPLPLKSTTNTTTPIIRVSAIDTIDHITDFESAADHALSLRKWQEMDLPITVPLPPNTTLSSNNARQPFRSVFESSYDKISKQAPRVAGDPGRWKFKGPWLAGQTEGEFQDYVKKTILRRRAAFRTFLKRWMETILSKDNAFEAMEHGKDQPPPVSLSKKEFEDALIELRHQPDRLYEAIWEFLDLPGSPPKLGLGSDTSNSAIDSYLTSKTTEQGPPATHPSAGISYIRSAAHIPNHPVLGPQASQKPVQSRVLRAKSSSAIKHGGGAALGVGGFVTTETGSTTFKPTGEERESGWYKMDPDLPGGAKAWVFPERARVDTRGRVRFHLREAHSNDIAIWEGKADARWLIRDFNQEGLGKPSTMADIIQNGPYGDGLNQKLQRPVEKGSGEGKARLPERRQDFKGRTDELIDNIISRRY